ncbi:MAG: ATP-grasp domain-containing protein [Cyclobacteriaceae bacterium]
MASQKVKWRRLFYRLTHWEFLPFSVFYFPIYFYFTWVALRCRSFFFFTASNPTIDFGGMIGASKAKILELIPTQYLPKYQLINPTEILEARAFASQIGYPVIVKPDLGERGKLVEVIQTSDALSKYHQKVSVPYLIQEYIDLPLELGVFYVKLPGSKTGQVSSIVQKEFLGVSGDGEHSVRHLLEMNPRALLQIDFEHSRFEQLMQTIPDKGEHVKVEPIGNHSRGTIFLDANHQITPALSDAIDKLCQEIEGFHFGRFDLRCSTWEELAQLKNFKILELNGAGAEPAHIYHPGASLFAGYNSVIHHLRLLGQISRLNRQQGTQYWTFRKGIRKLRDVRAYNQKIESLL